MWKLGGRWDGALGGSGLTMNTEAHDALSHAIGIGGHTAVRPMVAGPRAHNGDDRAIGADVDIVCTV